MNFTHAAIIPLAGGFSIGATKATGKTPEVIFSYKPFEANDKLYRQYLEEHSINVPYYQIDASSFDIDKIEQQYKNKISITHGTPPCSALSQAAQRKPGTRGSCEINDWMYLSTEFCLNHISPICHIIENAPGLFTSMGVDVRKKLLEIATSYGYSVTFYKTNTIRHGIPQFRPRTFAICYKGPNAPILSSYNKQPLHIIDFLKTIPESASLQDQYVTNEWDISNHEITRYLTKIYGEDWRKTLLEYKTHLTTYDYLVRVGLLQDFLEYQKSLPDANPTVTKNVEHIIRKKAMGMNARINYRVLGVDRDFVYAVIGEMMGRQIHPTENRLLNIREFMTLMGLPFDYEIHNPRDYVKITQNVPVTNDIVTALTD